MKNSRAILVAMLTASSLQAAEYHVSTSGLDRSDGSDVNPFGTISAAANIAQPGDVIIVHEGTYRERINPPRGGTSDEQRIVYQAAPGEKVVIKGSELVTDWKKVEGDVWEVVLPNSFFGDFNPFDDLIQGDWFHDLGREHHTGAVYLNGHWLNEAAKKEELFNPGLTKKVDSGYLFNVAWMNILGASENRFPAANLSEQQGIQKAPSEEGGECIGFIQEGDWASYEIDFGLNTEHMEFRVASETEGGKIEIRLGSPLGDLLATCTVPGTGGWQKWRTIKTPIVPTSGSQSVCLVFTAKSIEVDTAPLWFAEVDERDTTLWAQFKGVDPNRELVEVNARQTVFYPEHPGRNYITVRGFILRHAATPWAPPTAEQIGLIGTHWSKGWIIENNEVSHSICVGITLGKYGDAWDNRSESATAYNETIERALTNGWNKASVGSHVVRNNHISHCEQAGMVGSLGAVFSTIHNNEIHDIYTKKLFAGYEIAGIKFHASVDCTISHNHIYRCGGSGGGIWLDWMAQGTRVTGNLMHDNSVDLFLEVNHGPFLVDNNIFLSWSFLRDWSQGGAYVHNLIAGKIQVKPQGRNTPFHKAHSTEIAGLSSIPGGDDRFLNNILIKTGLDVYNASKAPMVVDGNIYLDTAMPFAKEAHPIHKPGFKPALKLVEEQDAVYLEITLPIEMTSQQNQLVTTELLGKARMQGAAFETPDGSPLIIDIDYFGNKRDQQNPSAGSFENPGTGLLKLKVWPKD